MAGYAQRGLKGNLYSMDGVDIPYIPSAGAKIRAQGGKNPMSTRGYNVLVNCNRRILSVNGGHHGYVPDSAKVLRHRVVLDHRDGLLPGVSSVEYTLYTDEDDERTVVITGATGISDGGFLDWPDILRGYQHPWSPEERLFNAVLESVRKDVVRIISTVCLCGLAIDGCDVQECTFGILKIRFRILKNLFLQFQSLIVIDWIFFSCCTLHNMILEDDNRDCMRTVTVAQVGAMVAQLGQPDAGLDIIRRRLDIESDDGSDFDDVGEVRALYRQTLVQNRANRLLAVRGINYYTGNNFNATPQTPLEVRERKARFVARRDQQKRHLARAWKKREVVWTLPGMLPTDFQLGI